MPVERVGLRRAAVALALLAAVGTSACAAGQKVQTANQKTTLDGVNATVGKIGLRALAIASPAGTLFHAVGSDPGLKLVLVNTGHSADKLTGITSSGFGGWGSFDKKTDAQAVQDAATATAAPSSAAPAPSGSAPAPLATGATEVDIPAGTRVAYGTPDSDRMLLLLKLTKKLYPANSIKITFTFQKAGSITVDVPVQLQTGARPNITIPQPSPTETAP